MKFSSINLQKLESTSYKETVSNQLNLEESLNRILLSEISTDSFEINFKNNKENLSIKFSSGIFEIDRSNFQTETGFDDNKRTLELGTFRKRFINKQTANFKSKVSSLEILLDNSSIEIFVNEGSLVMSDVFFYNSRFNVIEFSGLDDSLIEHQVLESIW